MTLEQSRETSRRMTQHYYVAGNQKQHMIWWHMTSREDFDENRKHVILIKISKQNTSLLHSKRRNLEYIYVLKYLLLLLLLVLRRRLIMQPTRAHCPYNGARVALNATQSLDKPRSRAADGLR
jgi:hypothetical protein